MYLSVILLLTPWMVCGELVNFSINKIELQSRPSTTLKNGENLRLTCSADIAKTAGFELNSTFYFFKDDNLIYNVTTTNDHAIYIIRNASVSRSGLYKCQISVDKKQKTSTEIKVKVTGLLPPVISVSKREVSEGDEITVRCEAPNEDPPMFFYFYKISKERESPKKRQSNKNNMETTFVIKEGESILQFECSVQLMIDDEPESPPSMRQMVTVVEPFGTPTINVHPANNFTEGSIMEVTCTVLVSHIRPEEVTITLQKGNQILQSSTTGRLTYSQVATVANMGNYTCKAEGRTASKTTITTINVKELFSIPRLTLKRSNVTQYINDGDLVNFECSVSGLSFEEARKQDFFLKVNKVQLKQKQRGGRFQLYLRATDSGNYTCEVTIGNITKISEPVPVKIYAAVAKPELKQIFRGNKIVVVLGDILTLTCKSPSGTPPIIYTLYRGGEMVGRKEMIDSREAVFTVNTTKFHQDLRQYKCHASNRNHKSSAYSEVLNVTVIAPVRGVSLAIIPPNGEVEEGAELSLICRVEYGTLPISIDFYVKKGNEILLRNETITNKMSAQFIVNPFTKQSDGTYFCTASNKAHKNVRSGSMDVKAVLARWKKGIIGGFVFFIIIAALGISLYLYLDKKRKGKSITTNTSRSSKAINSSSEKSAVDVKKTDDSYFGSVQNEEELHILKTAEDNIGNNQQNHEVEYTDVDGSAPESHQESAENNYTENPETNNLS
ncbi:platelet endothelial cell adhesion molecule [Pyxicephalus adspersus]|uniref:platelet endothelial cell adhesion molecule n=1 Tax=Pyxicephalus adspersus TaxID=30357 RepID=UPI003B5A4F68